MTPQHLDLLRFPLWGSQLIEASAGTGKTWTIAALVLRLVLGHGDGTVDSGPPAALGADLDSADSTASGSRTGFGRALLPGQILVMTFTRAATRELADRIRSRLLQAARCFRGEIEPPAGDTLLPALLQAWPPGPVREAAAGRLALAAEAMDEAAVHTIDAWCQRMLREHAFDSGCLFDEELLPSESVLRLQAARDHWRCHMLPLDDAGWAQVTALWPGGVEAMAQDVAQLSLQVPAAVQGGAAQPVDALAQVLARAQAERAEGLAQLRAGWAERAAQLRTWLDTSLQDASTPWDRRKLHARHYNPWLDTLAAWAADNADTLPELNKGWTRLTPAGLAEACKGPLPAPLPPAFAELQALQAALRQLPQPAHALRLHALSGVRQRLQALKAGSGRFGFADLLQRLDEALDDTRPGREADARRLRQRIVAQYPVALVDEFQDTSPVQLRIFDRLYRIADNDPATALLMIGDPKQSIYGFRGADIRSYLQARQATAGRHHMLHTNRRSTAAAVAAVNALFGHAERRPGPGAFGCGAAVEGGDGIETDAAGDVSPGGPPADAHSPLPFVPVQAQGRTERLLLNGRAVPGLQVVLDDEPLGAPAARRLAAARCAEHVVTLLAGAGFEEPGQDRQPLRPADIAVLVRSRTEAAAARQALARRGVASVYLSDQDSVFASAEAADLLRLLRAVAAPQDVRLARAALASGLIGLPLDALRQLAQDDDAFDARLQVLRDLHGAWRERGLLAMLRQALHRLELPQRLLRQGGADDEADSDSASDRNSAARGGERRLTNLLHLAELLQTASATLEGEQALLRWLAAQIDGVGTGLAGDEQVMRLESDANRVQVVTVHKSKGLEYPVVCLPFASHFRPVDKRAGWLRRLPPAGTRIGSTEALLDLTPDDAAWAAADAERLREDLRLLYVALTRARHHTWLGAAVLSHKPDAAKPTNTWHCSALGWLLSGAAAQTPEQIGAAWAALATSCPAISLQPAAPPGLTRWVPPLAAEDLRPLLRFDAPMDRSWTLASFSLLVRDVAAAAPEALLPAMVRDDEAPATAAVVSDDEDDGGAPDSASSPGPSLTAAGMPAVATASAGSSSRGPAEPSAPAEPPSPWHAFPRGPGPGNLLHEALERRALQGFAAVDERAQAAELQALCTRHGHPGHAAGLQAWLQVLETTPLPPFAAPLAGLQEVLPEMEFWLPNAGLTAARLDALCREHLLPGVERPALPPRLLHGLLMGFADLVVQHHGRWWVLDHKSNALGDTDAAYDAHALQQAVAAHRYDVQAAIYLLALHRLLRQRLGDGYDPAQHLGGAVFLFLRGLQGPQAGCCALPATPALLQALDDLLPLPTGEDIA